MFGTSKKNGTEILAHTRAGIVVVATARENVPLYPIQVSNISSYYATHLYTSHAAQLEYINSGVYVTDALILF